MVKNWKPIILKKIEELDPKKEILTIFDEESKKIDFSDCIKQHQKQKLKMKLT